MRQILRPGNKSFFTTIFLLVIATGLLNSSVTRPLDPSLITQEIRYHINGAAKVFLLWGINGWRTLPSEIRPPHTTIRDEVMFTSMTHSGDAFSMVVHVPIGTTIDYVFWIPQTNDGLAIDVWD